VTTGEKEWGRRIRGKKRRKARDGLRDSVLSFTVAPVEDERRKSEEKGKRKKKGETGFVPSNPLHIFPSLGTSREEENERNERKGKKKREKGGRYSSCLRSP